MIQGIYNRTFGAIFSKLATSSPATTMSAKQTVEDAIAAHKIAIFSKSYCPFCTRAKNLINTTFPHLKGQIYVKELDLADDGTAIQEYLAEKTRQKTVPNIFINKDHVGGCDKLISIQQQGQLVALVEGSA
ncbi:putative GRX1-glutaredoxin [Thelephora terrestris]|uniref:GRX1-glutaredoxin n=1 Tax=Thelephora terrestris TaxID=56493 RepID=A0A9P6HH70_9AGAM|nr:putative GRX1-glutaredoxin [Thelephora terrestris]